MGHSTILCSCPRDALCDRCRETLWSQLRGVAARRGEALAERVRHGSVHAARAWPPYDSAQRDLAVGLVSDLTSDPQLLELLAVELARWAAKRWAAFEPATVTHPTTGTARHRR